ncbi:peptidoglycan DD-metalloendopeptidase family protein [Desulfocastanea catecholica]
MDEQLHIIIAGNKGKVFKLPCSRKKICLIISASVVALLVLTVTSIVSFSLYSKNCTISNQLVRLQEKLHTSSEQMARRNMLTEEERLKLDIKVARLELNNMKQARAKKEKESLLSTAIEELNVRNELIEKIIGSIGIKIPQNNDGDSKHRGGLFIEQPDTETDELLYKADKYLNTIRCLPLGTPVQGSITSRFGKRKDPLNKKSAFHPGVDIRGKRGEKIYATADGVVIKSFRNGGYGNYVVIDHGNGYTTSYAHMQKYLVQKGNRVERGQLIGLVGNTGRSTGPHLHYEIALDDKPINPHNFMKVASLLKKTSSLPEKK